MEGHHHHPRHHHHHRQQQQQSIVAVNVEATDRFPQWSVQETKELLTIRAELDQTFMETKRNKLLWKVISNKMKGKGFDRSADQCKCKWKNLVTRYKGCEAMDAEMVRQQFPFYDDMQAIFTARMKGMLWVEAGRGETSGSKKKTTTQLSCDEEDGNEESEERLGDSKTSSRKINPKRRKNANSGSSGGGGVREVLEELMKQQMRTEREWKEAWEAKEKERVDMEMEWRRKMEELEKERVAMERMWRDREEQRRLREEARAEKRDALITALMNKLTKEGSN